MSDPINHPKHYTFSDVEPITAIEAAEAHEDDSGEAVPSDLRREFNRAERLLREEEARVALGEGRE